MKNIYLTAFIFLSGVFYNKAIAESETKFIMPVACHYGEECWVVNFVDVDPVDNAAADFKCGPKTYDKHKGTDFALASVRQMNAGVNVLAAADGRVLRFRDTEDDRLKTPEELAEISGANKDCGNGILIDHGNGLQTIYCHLKKDSVVVEAKQKVRAGQHIAQVGQSGVAEFPHLHFGVVWEDGIMDPYTGALATAGCGQDENSMWHAGLPLKYEPVVIFDGGFRSTSPDFEAIKRGEENPATLTLNSAAFVFWAGFYNVEKGDEIHLVIKDPDDKIFVERRESMEKNRARQYYFTGRKIGQVQLKAGTYIGTATIKRGARVDSDEIIREKVFSVKVE
ncbi:MAG: peptidoglycan DD-metalloendopeptidase family protein [Alphaproteobacteria bacterium]|nr:peptidoglycan DD-metalloendopeptidase family protein [Alphaproteobacteria bacterium]